MEFVARTPLPFAIQTPVPTISGNTTASVGGRLAHLLPFLRGTPIRHSPHTAEGLANIGAAVWQLQEHMATYPDPYDTEHPWALGSLGTVLQKLDAVTPDNVRQGCERILTHMVEATLPRLASLPTQPTHNDAHTDNVLVDGQTVVGIVDWGDSITQPRVADLAVAASYARGYHPMWLEGDPWQAAHVLRQGYINAGGPDDHADLFGELVIARLAQRIVLNLAIAQHATDGGDYARRNMVNSVQDINDLFLTRAPDVFPSLGRDPLW
jgi:hydroxylysine kinase